MAAEKPFGWRPFDEDQRASFRNSGMTDEQIATMEETNVYRPVEYGIQALELGVAISEVLAARFGGEIAVEIQTCLARRAENLAREEDVESQVESPIVRALAEYPIWHRLKALEPKP